jgi:hypothetical protein
MPDVLGLGILLLATAAAGACDTWFEGAPMPGTEATQGATHALLVLQSDRQDHLP